MHRKHSFFIDIQGTKRSRKGTEAKYSVIESKNGDQFTLLPGKPRDDLEGTFRGKGKTARVKLAKDKNEQIVAVKIGEADSDIIDGFIREYNVLKVLGRNPTLINADNKLYLFQPYFSGIKLRKGRNVGYVPKLIDAINKSSGMEQLNYMFQCVDVWLRVIDATTQVHKLGIIHGDLYPENLLFDQNKNRVELIDFGMSSIVKDFKKPESLSEVAFKKEIDKYMMGDFYIVFAKLLKGFNEENESIRKFSDFLSQVRNCLTKKNVNKVGYDEAVNQAKLLLNEKLAVLLKEGAKPVETKAEPESKKLKPFG